MNQLRFFPHCIVFCIIVLLHGAAVGAGGEFAPHSTTDVEAQPEQPAGVPVLFIVKLANTGTQPISYWVALGGKYPSAKLFKARVTDGEGKVQELQMSNDYIEMGSGGFRQISPGQSVTIPALIHALPAGTYTIQVRTGKSARVTVKEDEEVARKRDQEMLARIRKLDSFAQYVAAKYPTKGLMVKLLEELASDDPQVAYSAAEPLSRIHELPANSSQLISRALTKQLDLARQRLAINTGIFFQLAYLASRVGTDEALEAVLRLAQTERVRGEAVWALGAFKQEKALKQLRLFLTDQDEQLQFRAAQRLAEKKDPPALDVLLTVAHDPKSRWRMYSFDALLKYSDDPRVEPAIKSGLDDPNNQVRQSAEFALRRLASQMKPKP